MGFMSVIQYNKFKCKHFSSTYTVAFKRKVEDLKNKILNQQIRMVTTI